MSGENEMASPTSPSWVDRLRQSVQDSMADFDPETCEGCKWVGAGGMFGAGAYVSYVGYRRSKLAGSRWGFLPSAITGAILATLGVVRLTDYNPFSSTKKFGIDALDPLKDSIAKRQAMAEMKKKLEQEAGEQQRLGERTAQGGSEGKDS